CSRSTYGWYFDVW
nr:immunoglobulin heavy chain junction region [Mus musculus]